MQQDTSHPDGSPRTDDHATDDTTRGRRRCRPHRRAYAHEHKHGRYRFGRKLLLVLLLVGAAVAGAAVARFDGHRVDRFADRVSEQLALDSGQHADLMAVLDDFRDLRRDLRAHRETARHELLALLDGDTLDQQRLLGLIQEKTRAIEQQAPQTVAALAAFYDGLDSYQRDKLRAFVEKRAAKRWWQRH